MAGRYTARQVAGVIQVAGGPPGGTTVAEWVALAEHESGYDPEIVNPYGAVGMWQVVARKHMARIARVTGKPVKNVSDAVALMQHPIANYLVSKDIYAERGWQPWAASHAPSQSHLAAAASPETPGHDAGLGDLGPLAKDPSALLDAAGDIAGNLNPVNDVATAIRAAVDALGQVTEWVTDPNTWKRVALVIAGLGLVWVGVGTVLQPAVEPTLRTAKGVASKATVAGKATRKVVTK